MKINLTKRNTITYMYVTFTYQLTIKQKVMTNQVKPLSENQDLKCDLEIKKLKNRLIHAEKNNNLILQAYCYRSIAKLMERKINGWDRN